MSTTTHATSGALRAPGHAGRRPLRKSLAGFTMIELLVVVTMVVILGALAIPAFTNVTTSNRVASQINGLLGDIQYARAEAIKEGLSVGVCSSTDGLTCSGTNTWTTGWIVFADSAGNGVVAANEPVLRVQKALTGSNTLTADNNTNFIVFNRDGFAFGLPGTVTFSLHSPTSVNAYTRCLSVNLVGRLATEVRGQTLQGGNPCT
ncbi:MAG: GspH/FimT family pseudopilin [Steroidobacteraceae bacterium]|jgi:type IV fimbrial biogenesis protein FimT